jgi:stage II sporulation protein GA (sporulation sigma-E factor processing peptidase)
VCTRVAVNLPTSKWGIGLACVLGGVSSLVVFIDERLLPVSVALKLIIGAIIVLLSFLPRSVKSFLKAYTGFFIVSALFGGVMYFLEITFRPHGIMYVNGTVYFDMSIKYLVGCTFLIYGVFLIVNYFFERKATKNQVYKVNVAFRNMEIAVLGYIDTGNSLVDSLTGRTVFVGEVKSFAPLFTYEEQKFLKNINLDNIPGSLAGVIHLVPCKTVGESALLPAFVPDRIEVEISKNIVEVKNVSIALTDVDFSQGEYSLLLNKRVIE